MARITPPSTRNAAPVVPAACSDVDEMLPGGWKLGMSIYHRPAQPPGPAGTWFVDTLKATWSASESR